MSADPQALAQALVQARRQHARLVAADWSPSLSDAAEAYAVQDAVAATLGWFGGGVPRHWKSGGGSRQAALTHAPLPPAGVRTAIGNEPADVRDLPLHTRGIEAEIALRLGADVDAARAAALSPQAAHALVDMMAVSIEVVDSRWREGTQAPALLRLADQQSHGGLVLGEWLPYAERDWATQGCTVRIGNDPPATYVGTHSLLDPAWLLPLWLRHATRGGVVAAGTVVTTGTWCGLLQARAGDLVQVEFAGIGTALAQF